MKLLRVARYLFCFQKLSFNVLVLEVSYMKLSFKIVFFFRSENTISILSYLSQLNKELTLATNLNFLFKSQLVLNFPNEWKSSFHQTTQYIAFTTLYTQKLPATFEFDSQNSVKLTSNVIYYFQMQ